MNWRGTYTLFYRETWRFLRVIIQTLFAPMVSALLFLVIFGHLLESRVTLYEGIAYSSFLVPGLMMMSIMQNATANASSSLIQSKLMGNLVFVLMSPLSSLELFIGFVGAAIVRGLLVAISVFIVALFFTDVAIHSWIHVLTMAFLCSFMMGALGLLAGIWADKVEQLAFFQNFIIMPLSFLSGVFYSIQSLPEIWQTLSHFNPFFYMIDGFRYGFLGYSDVEVTKSIGVVAICTVVISLFVLSLLKKGYKIRN